ncbi:MAG TPA: GNAT family N-acetyltransferase [Acetivibrio sp.]|uniref:GNAT family N-acetyltransferase n=1 Tax=Acetivibrio sp. TaxID=1872092 RepID=UPI002CEFEEB3|nr:GNAT family N-acetyltransferase [Acetivibrio sp.]HOM03144.1 GNAT family N-acetyltransferase [Acetivibrio sp.]
MYQIVNHKKGDFNITTDFERIDIDSICMLLSRTYWANNRSRDIIIKSLENSLCFSLFHNERQIGLVRVITDCATFAYLCDVVIDEGYRGKGLGQWLMECVLNHPDLQNLRRWCLVTKDAHEFYRKFGFENVKNPEIYMEISNI